jgi:hypothetical protein
MYASLCSLDEAYGGIIAPVRDRKRKKDRSRVLFHETEAFTNPEPTLGGQRPRLPPPEPEVIEPDRPAHRRLPPAELLGGGPTENIQSSSVSQMLNAFDSESYFPHPHADTSDRNMYMLEPDWSKQFTGEDVPEWMKDRMASRDAEVPLTPSPWLDGGSTLWQRIPSFKQGDPVLKEATVAADSRLDDLQRKFDSMFQKLEDIDRSRAESNHIEILMFVLGGVFLLLMLDMLVKQGTQATMLVAAAGGMMPVNTATNFIGGFMRNRLF